MLFGLNWGHTKEVVITVKLQALVVIFYYYYYFAPWISVDHTIRWIVIYPLESVIHLSNNQALKF